MVEVTLVIFVLARLVAPVIFKFVPVALVNSRFAKVPTWIKLGKEVEADNERNVLVATAG